MNSPEVQALTPVVEALESLGAPYRVGGSVASSALGVPRSTLDVDIVVELAEEHAEPLEQLLQRDYYVDAQMIKDAIRRTSSFNVVHLDTMVKVDVFVRKNRPFDEQAFTRKQQIQLEPGAPARTFDVTTAEDIILHKLEWYRLGGEISERQWTDVVGVIDVQGDALDRDYMSRWAVDLGVADLLARALSRDEDCGR